MGVREESVTDGPRAVDELSVSLQRPPEIGDGGSVDEVPAVIPGEPPTTAGARPPAVTGGGEPRPGFHAQRAGRQGSGAELVGPRFDAYGLDVGDTVRVRTGESSGQLVGVAVEEDGESVEALGGEEELLALRVEALGREVETLVEGPQEPRQIGAVGGGRASEERERRLAGDQRNADRESEGGLRRVGRVGLGHVGTVAHRTDSASPNG
jgi:hypothetical protein